MYSIIVGYNDFSYEEDCYSVMKITTIVNDLTSGKVYKTLRDAKEMLNIIKNELIRKDYLISELFIRTSDNCIQINDIGALDISISIEETKQDKIKKEERIICKLDKRYKNIDIFNPFIVKLYGIEYEVLSVKYEDNTLLCLYLIDPEDGSIKPATDILEYGKNRTITKNNVPEGYMYIYDEIMKIAMNDIL